MISFLSRSLAQLSLAACLVSAVPALAEEAQAPANAAEGAPGSFVNPFTSVESQTLGDIDANFAGLIDESGGGLPPSLWSGTNRLVVETLLPRLPAPATSPAMIDLARRLLLSRALSPQGATSGISLIAARLDRALAIGQVNEVQPLAEQMPAKLDTPEVLAARADALLYEGNDADACTLAERARGRGRGAAWTKRLAFCSALAGKVAEARLAVDVLADTGDEDDGFAKLMAKWVDKAKIKSVGIAHPAALHFAMLRQTEVALDDDSLKTAGPSFLTAWAAYEKAPLAQRVAAAELAASSGVLPASALTSLYLEVKLKPDLLSAPFDAEKMPLGPDGAAYVVQRLTEAEDPTERGHLIAAALSAAKARGVLPGVAEALGASLSGIDAAPELADDAATLGMGEVLAGEGVIARRWLDLLSSAGKADTEPAYALRSLMAARGDVAGLAWSPDDFLSRINAVKPDKRSRADLEWALLRALGASKSDAISLAVLGGPLVSGEPSPAPSVMDGLKAAALQHRLGETVLFALIAIGDGGPRDAHPAALALAITALAHVGLTADARALATEALAWRMP